ARVIERYGERLLPLDFRNRQIRPETDVIVGGLLMHARELRRLQGGVLRHGCPPSQAALAMRRTCCLKIFPNPWVSKKASSPARFCGLGFKSSNVAAIGMSQTMPVKRRARYAVSL